MLNTRTQECWLSYARLHCKEINRFNRKSFLLFWTTQVRYLWQNSTVWLELRRSISNQKNVARMIERSKKASGMRIPRLESKGVGATNAPSDNRKKAYFCAWNLFCVSCLVTEMLTLRLKTIFSASWWNSCKHGARLAKLVHLWEIWLVL